VIARCLDAEVVDVAELERGWDLVARREELARGWSCELDGLWSEPVADALALEADATAASATMALSHGYQVQNGGLSGPVWYASNEGGDVLRGLLNHNTAIAVASAAAGRAMVPVGAAYLYYRPGNFCGLHTDRRDFEVQLMVSVLGDLGPLLAHPDLLEVPVEELAQRGRCGDLPTEGLELRYPRLGATVFSGVEIPHQRPHHTGPGLGAVASLCYRTADAVL
jgi:hypothetical protein